MTDRLATLKADLKKAEMRADKELIALEKELQKGLKKIAAAKAALKKGHYSKLKDISIDLEAIGSNIGGGQEPADSELWEAASDLEEIEETEL